MRTPPLRLVFFHMLRHPVHSTTWAVLTYVFVAFILAFFPASHLRHEPLTRAFSSPFSLSQPNYSPQDLDHDYVFPYGSGTGFVGETN